VRKIKFNDRNINIKTTRAIEERKKKSIGPKCTFMCFRKGKNCIIDEQCNPLIPA
jgi:hypothetical protein